MTPLSNDEARELGRRCCEAVYPVTEFGELSDTVIQATGRMMWKIVKRWEGEILEGRK